MNKPANPTCATCRHECRRGLPFLPFIKGQYCGHPSALDCVTGKAVTDCAEMRKVKARRGDPTAFCGLQGRNWEARELRPVPSNEGPLFFGDARRPTDEEAARSLASAVMAAPSPAGAIDQWVKLPKGVDPADFEKAVVGAVLADQPGVARDRVDPVTAIVQRMKPR